MQETSEGCEKQKKAGAEWVYFSDQAVARPVESCYVVDDLVTMSDSRLLGHRPARAIRRVDAPVVDGARTVDVSLPPGDEMMAGEEIEGVDDRNRRESGAGGRSRGTVSVNSSMVDLSFTVGDLPVIVNL